MKVVGCVHKFLNSGSLILYISETKYGRPCITHINTLLIHLSHRRNLADIVSRYLRKLCNHHVYIYIAYISCSIYLDQALEKRLNHHPSKTVIVFLLQLSQIVCEACTATKEINGFQKNGISISN